MISPGDPVIRAGEPADCPRIAEMVAGLARSTGVTPPAVTTAADLLAYGFGARPAFSLVVAERPVSGPNGADTGGGGLIGYCLFTADFSTWRACPGIYVVDLFIEEAARGARLGERLLAAALQAGRTWGARYVKLEIDLDNARARAFYERLGFHELDHDRLMVLEASGADRLLG
ncbi:MAG: GNAT family N-acetyltransferase [Rhizobiales bacterium]|nr:GNAT family N-acetyltransferase [Hyphomicrobiales bacterium]